MVETSKQVRVDNWGIYFLQRLQLFFSKTDFCDLTLQFEGNVQLKVHRLVMNACTEYFAFLEQTCPALEENTIMMPTDLQADVIVPIVNFMYTGMLEFHPSIFQKLYKAAETMNIAVLTKLLEAQLQPISKLMKKNETPVRSWGAKKSPKPTPVVNDLPSPSPLPGRKLPVWRKRTAPVAHPVSATFSNTKWNSDPPEKDPLMVMDNTPKPTRFEWPEDDQPPFSIDPSFDDVSLTSKPLWTKEDDQKAAPPSKDPLSLGVKSRQNSSRSNSISHEVEVEIPHKEQKVSVSQIDDLANVSGDNSLKRKPENKLTSSPKRVKITNQDDETIISIKTNNPSELDHTKIVSEILRKYPDLVKKKKNIKLKISSTKNEQSPVKVQTAKEKSKPQPPPTTEKPQSILHKKEIKVEPTAQKELPSFATINNKRPRQNAEFRAASEEGPWTCMECLGDGEASEFVLYYLFRKHMNDVHRMDFDASLCKYCGRKCPTDQSMAYHLYTKHGLRLPSHIRFPKCPRCPFIGLTAEKLQEHLKIHGEDEVQCGGCKLGFLTQKDLANHHHLIGHNNRSKSTILDCPYCMKKLQSAVSLFTHIRVQHLKEGKRDGITSLDEIMDIQDEEAAESVQHTKEEVAGSPEKNTEIVISTVDEKQQQILKDRVKILSNVKVATRQEDGISDNALSNAVEHSATSEAQPVAVATTTAAALSNIGGSLATNLGLVDIVVLDDNQQYILQQPAGQSGNAEFILPELTGNEGILQAATAGADLNSTDELVMVLTDHDYQDEQNQDQSDNSNIVVLYSHPVEGQQGQFITSQGNLLVNSQGMLEIRNGAGITTTAGQLLVNSDTTTTTQATESPIESIELIRKEIEGEVVVEEEERNNIRAALRKKVLEKEINKLEENIEATKEIYQNVQNNVNSNMENGPSESHELLDTTDSSIQEEPMEVDQIGPEIEHTKESHTEEENPSLGTTVENQGTDVREPTTDQTNEEADQDIPPDTTRRIQEQPEVAEESEGKANTSDQFILNDPSEFQEILQHNQNSALENANAVPMEVDGTVTESNQRIEGEDQVDNNLPKTDNVSNADNQIEELSASDSIQDQTPDGTSYDHRQDNEDLPQQESLQQNQESSIENNQDESIEDDQSSNKDNDHELNKENFQELITNNDQPTSLENPEMESLVDNQETCLGGSQESNRVQEPIMENDQEQATENDQEPDVGNEPETNLENSHEANMENENHADNDQNDNIQPNFDDFTDESQQSSSQKTHRELNKEILDDWDDTDSQQSQSQEQEVQDQAALNAAENVSKLMDDWDEEDEDQSKE